MRISELDEHISSILKDIVQKEKNIELLISGISESYKLSAKNLCRYLILRNYDLTKYHDSLSELGLSSLRTAEGYVYSNLFSIVKNLKLIQGLPFKKKKEIEIVGYKRSKQLIKTHANELFNKKQKKQFTEIMVTLPNEAAKDKSIIKDMVKNGMEIARINLSHGNIEMWTTMVQYIHEVMAETKKEVKIYMDLSGPKIRTSQIEIRGKKGKVKNALVIRQGERIIVTKRTTLGKKSKFDKKNGQLQKAEIGVMLHEIIDDVQVNDVILFDDGMIKAIVVAKYTDEVEIEITDCYKTKLSSHKGINLPNTKLHLPALTEKDKEYLPFVCKHANIIGYSFVRSAHDVACLYKELETYNAHDLGVVFKIENKEAFENLPFILLEGMKRPKIGVMIARGDLAVEIGFENISEVQNQILLLCEAAHVPVIWATQVLENLAKTGIPTRAEISDVVLGVQAECIMLNKGKYILEAIKTLKNILIKIEPNSFKNKHSLKPLEIAIHTCNTLFA
jgi:pyruvate kinase